MYDNIFADLRSGDILSNSYVNRQHRTSHSTSDVFIDYLSEPICCRGNSGSTSSSFYDDTCGYCGGKTSLKVNLSCSYWDHCNLIFGELHTFFMHVPACVSKYPHVSISWLAHTPG